jgi:hypothetical protein
MIVILRKSASREIAGLPEEYYSRVRIGSFMRLIREVLPELVWVSIVYLLLHDFEFQILKVSKAMAALDDSLDHVIESFGKTGKGLKPLKLLLGIDVHVLKPACRQAGTWL